MPKALEVTDERDHRQSGLHTHAFILGAFLTQLQVSRDAVLGAKTEIAQHNCQPLVALNKNMEVLVMGVERGPVPGHHLSLMVEQPAQLDAYTPAFFVFTFLATCCGLRPCRMGKSSSIG